MSKDPVHRIHAVIELIETLGYKVSCRRGQGTVELRAVLLSDPTPANTHIARNCDGDGDEDLYQTAWALAEMVGIHIEG
jgi:hypothetical protein